MGTYTHRCDHDYRNEGWNCVGQPQPWQCLSDSSDSTWVSCPSTPQRVTVGFPVDLTPSQIPANAVFVSISIFIRCMKTTAAVSPINVNILSGVDTSKFTQRTVYPTQSISTIPVGTYQTDPRGNPWGMWELDSLLAQVSTVPGSGVGLDGVRVYELYSVVNFRVAPTLTVTAPFGTVKTPSPVLSWVYGQTDGDRQSKIDINVYTASVHDTVTFNPDISTNAIFSKTFNGDVNFVTLPTALTPGDYYVYMRAWSTFNAKSQWASHAFSVLGPSPGIPNIESVTLDNTKSSATLALRDTSNMVSVQGADAETAERSEYVTTNCTVIPTTSQVFGLGSAAWQMTASSAATMSALSPLVAISPSTPMTGTVQWKAGATGRTATINVLFYDGAYTAMSGTLTANLTDSTATWQGLTATGTSPVGAVYARLQLQVTSPANAEVHYFDAVGMMYGSNSAWSNGGHMSRNMLDADYSSHPGYQAWVTASGTTLANVTSGITQTGANGPNAMSLTSTAVTPSISFVGAGTVFSSTTAATTFTLTAPAGLALGDFLVAIVTCDNPVAVNVPAGWTQVVNFDSGSANQSNLIILKRTAGASEPASWTDGTFSQVSGRRQAVVLAYRGAADASVQMLADNVSYNISGSPTSVATGTVTNTDTNAWRMSAFTFNNPVAGGSLVANIAPATNSTISFVAAASPWTSADGNGFTLNKPAGIQTGDLMIASMAVDGYALTVTPPTGWNLVRNIQVTNSDNGWSTLTIMSRTAGASEPNSWSGTAAVGGGGVMNGRVTQVSAYRGCDTAANQFINEAASTDSFNGDSTITTATVSNTNSSSWAISAFGCRTDSRYSSSVTSTMSRERSDYSFNSPYFPVNTTLCMDDSGGTVGTGSYNYRGTFSRSYSTACAWLGFLKAAPTGPTPPANETQRATNIAGVAFPWILTSAFDSNGPTPLGPVSVTGILTPGSGSVYNSVVSYIALIKPAVLVATGTVQATATNYIDISHVDPAVLALAGNQVTITGSFLGSVAGTPYLSLAFYRANQLLTTRIARGNSYNTSTWTRSVATFDLPAGTTRIVPTVSASGLNVNDVAYVDSLGVALGASPVWRPGTTLTTHPVWNISSIQYAENTGLGYGDWAPLNGVSLSPPIYDNLSGGLSFVDQTLTPRVPRKYRAQTQTYGLGGDLFVSAFGAETTPVTLTGSNWWLKDLANPTTNLQLLVKAIPLANTANNTATVLQPLGRNRPITVSDGFKGDTFDLTMLVSQVDFVDLKALCESGNTLLLQSDVDRSWWVRPISGIKDETIVSSDRQNNPLRWVTVTFLEVDPVS